MTWKKRWMWFAVIATFLVCICVAVVAISSPVYAATLPSPSMVNQILPTEQQIGVTTGITPTYRTYPPDRYAFDLIDGNIMERTLAYKGYTKEWVLGELMKQGATHVKDVFLAQIDGKGSVYVDLYADDIEQAKVKDRPMVHATMKKVQADMERFAIDTQEPTAKEAYSKDAATLKKIVDVS